jgi:hypothetical protein|tara:strand:- start:293 stop:463 length:171 start_codon:yes stop_codon:yes gene_type:complete
MSRIKKLGKCLLQSEGGRKELTCNTIERFKVVADKDKRKISNIVKNLIKRYVESRV